MIITDKKELRALLRTRLRAISDASKKDQAEAAVEILARQLKLNNQRIVAYWPRMLEFDSCPLIDYCRSQATEIYLPATISPEEMTFRLLDAPVPTARDFLGLACPPENNPTIDCQDINLALLPLTGFDDTGQRLGTGGGYYDRYFATKITRRLSPPGLIGLAFEQQRYPKIPSDSCDVKLDAVLTAEKLTRYSDYLHAAS